MHGTETGSPELSAAWRVLAAQGPMGQEKHWAEVVETLDRRSQARVMADIRVAGRHVGEKCQQWSQSTHMSI